MSILSLFIAYWGEHRWGRLYGYRSPIYMGGTHRGHDVEGKAWGGQNVPSLTDGRVVRTYRTAKLGWIIVVDLGAHYGAWRYLAYCHMAETGAARDGTWLNRGDNIGHMAGVTERPGIVGVTWLGRHLHLVWTNATDGADVNRPHRDPALLIRQMLTDTASGGANPFDPKGFLMALTDDEQQRLLERTDAVYAGMFGPANVGASKLAWANPFGDPAGEAFYGLLPVTIRNQVLIAQQAAQLAALTELVKQMQGGAGVVDMSAVQDAAEAGAKAALSQFPTAEQIADAVNDDAAKRLIA